MLLLSLFLAFLSFIGNVIGLILWGMQSKLSDSYTFALIVNVISLIKIIWIWSHSFIPCCKKLFLYIITLSSWMLSWLWIINSILLSSVTGECLLIYNCNGEIITLTFTVLSTIIWTIIAIHVSNLIYKKEDEQSQQESQMEEVNSDMEEIPL